MDYIFKNIRKKSINAVIYSLLGIGFFITLAFFTCKDNWLFWVVVGGCVLYFISVTIPDLSIAINPAKSRIFKKYGGYKKVEQMLIEIDKDKIYENDTFIMSKKYITNKADLTDLTSFAEVLGVHKLRNMLDEKNVSGYGIVLTDKFGDQHKYLFNIEEEKKCDSLLLLIASLCPKAKYGYNKDEQDYIKQNTTKI